MLLGFFNELVFKHRVAKDCREGYPELYDRFEAFYLLYVYRRVRDCWNKPITSVPGALVTVKERKLTSVGFSLK